MLLFTIPTRSVETNLVRDTEYSQSCVVLEIKMSEEQVDVSLRRFIQEFTQCHLSLVVMRNSGSYDDRGVRGDSMGGYQRRH